jgi:hypothetical protein
MEKNGVDKKLRMLDIKEKKRLSFVSQKIKT